MSAAPVTWGLHRSPPIRRASGLRRPSSLPGPLPGLRRLHHPQGPLRRLPLRAVRSLLLALLERRRHFTPNDVRFGGQPVVTELQSNAAKERYQREAEVCCPARPSANIKDILAFEFERSTKALLDKREALEAAGCRVQAAATNITEVLAEEGIAVELVIPALDASPAKPSRSSAPKRRGTKK